MSARSQRIIRLRSACPDYCSCPGKTVQITETLAAPVYANRSSEAKVAVQSGQTIVIGGLIEDSVKQTHRKVPLFGDIPLFGALFRRTIDTVAKTELLIFLTPLVAETEEELAAISIAQQALTSVALGNVAKDPDYQRYIKSLPESAPAR